MVQRVAVGSEIRSPAEVSMYASIHRYHATGIPRADPSEVGWRLGAVLARSPGFIVAIVVEDSAGALFTIKLFDDQASLTAATPVAERWLAEYCGKLQQGATQVAIGEVVAQKGL